MQCLYFSNHHRYRKINIKLQHYQSPLKITNENYVRNITMRFTYYMQINFLSLLIHFM